MIERVAETIGRYAMFEPGQRAGVAVSGGADSVCLLHVLLELAPRWDLKLSVLHLDHGLRGEESRQDAEFVRGLAGRWGLPFHLRAANLAEVQDNLEQAAREARLAFFRESIAQGLVDRIALGHTRSDQAETVLFRILRGAGSAGLAGVRPVTSDGIVRPLIRMERPEVEQFLRERGIAWREDSSNRSLEFARNRIRHELLPRLAAEWNPAIAETLAHTADWAQAEEAYWDAELQRLSAGHLVDQGQAVLMRADWLQGLPLAAARRIVRHAIERAKGDLLGIDFRHVAAVLELAASREGSGRLQANGVDIFRSFEWIRLGRPGADSLDNRNYRFPVPVPGSVALPGRETVIHTQLVENSEASELSESVYNRDVGRIDWRCVSGSLEVRNWRPGDEYQPVGHTGTGKIKTLFQDARIPLWDRRHWPVLTDGSSIVWVRQFGTAAQYAAGPETKVVLHIRETAAG